MRTLTAVFALGSCIAAALAGPAPAMAQQSLAQQSLAQQSLAQQSFLYPPEVRVRPVVMVLDPRLERHSGIRAIAISIVPRRTGCVGKMARAGDGNPQ